MSKIRPTLEEELRAILLEEFVSEHFNGIERRDGGSQAGEGEAERRNAHHELFCRVNVAKQ